jgi:tetratricopeptide (TPR) repeat protein
MQSDSTRKRSAEAAMARRDWAEALESWTWLVAQHPEDLEAVLGKAAALRKTGQLNDAELMLADAMTQFPEDSRPALKHAEFAVRREDWDLALLRYDYVCSRFPNEPYGRLGKGDVLLRLGRFDQADAVFLKLTEDFPQFLWGYCSYARCAASQTDWTEALLRWGKVSAISGQHDVSYVGRIEALRHLKRFNEAERLAEEAALRFPDDRFVLIARAQIPAWSGNWSEALQRWHSILERFPDDLQAQSGASRALAEIDLERLLGKPTMALGRATLGWLAHIDFLAKRKLNIDQMAAELQVSFGDLSAEFGWRPHVLCRFVQFRNLEIDTVVLNYPLSGRHLEVLINENLFYDDHFQAAIGRLPIYLWLFGAAKSRSPSFSGAYACLLSDLSEFSHGLSFCSNKPDTFLTPDAFYFNSAGYARLRPQIELHKKPWAERVAKAVWRGSSSGMRRYWPSSESDFRWLPRVELCARCRGPQLDQFTDVGITGSAGISDPSLLRQIDKFRGAFLPKERFAEYKYAFVIDGNSNSWSSLLEGFLVGSCVLLIESERGFRQWFYDRVEPWKHYVPIRADMEDLEAKVQLVVNNDKLAQEIAERANAWIRSMDFLQELDGTVDRLIQHADAYRLNEGEFLPDAQSAR